MSYNLRKISLASKCCHLNWFYMYFWIKINKIKMVYFLNIVRLETTKIKHWVSFDYYKLSNDNVKNRIKVIINFLKKLIY